MNSWPNLHESVGRYFGRNRQDGVFGVEIEVEGERLPARISDHWTTHHDGSLRGEAIEYVFARPLNRDASREALVDFQETFKANKSVANKSLRTSVHIHYNVLNWKLVDLYTAIAAYFLFENLLVRYSGDYRQGNLFCLRISDVENVVLDIKASCSVDHHFRFANDNYRYSALNFASMPRFGSLEFRSFRGTTDIEEIWDWMTLIDHLMTTARSSFRSPLELAEFYIKEGLEAVIDRCVPITFARWIRSNPDYQMQIDTNFRYLVEIATAIDWRKALEKKKAQPEEEVEERPVNIDQAWRVLGIPEPPEPRENPNRPRRPQPLPNVVRVPVPNDPFPNVNPPVEFQNNNGNEFINDNIPDRLPRALGAAEYLELRRVTNLFNAAAAFTNLDHAIWNVYLERLGFNPRLILRPFDLDLAIENVVERERLNELRFLDEEENEIQINQELEDDF